MVDKLPENLVIDVDGESNKELSLNVTAAADDSEAPYHGISDIPADGSSTTTLCVSVVQENPDEKYPKNASPSGTYSSDCYYQVSGTYFARSNDKPVVEFPPQGSKYPSGTPGPHDYGTIVLKTSNGELSQLSLDMLSQPGPLQVDLTSSNETVLAEISAHDPLSEVNSHSIQVQFAPNP